MNTQWSWMDTGAEDPYVNMAIDEALLESAASVAVPTLRFYGWSASAATFGYFQHYAAVESYTKLRPLIRRPTGGGLVGHDHDWTYSLVIPPGDEWYDLTATRSYEMLHEWLGVSLAVLNVETGLSQRAWTEAPGQCFAGAERFDLLSAGRKIAGAAQRRSRLGLLIQGSVQPKLLTTDRNKWQEAMLKSCPREGMFWSGTTLSAEVKLRAEILAESKYRRKEYNQKR